MPTSVKKIGPLPAFQTPGKFVEETLVNAPFTTIQNRAKVSTSLKPIMGNERIHVNSLNLLPNEFGPNGEPVYEPDSGDARVRFVDNGWTKYGIGAEILASIAENIKEDNISMERVGIKQSPIPSTISLAKHSYPNQYILIKKIEKILKKKIFINRKYLNKTPEDQPNKNFLGPF